MLISLNRLDEAVEPLLLVELDDAEAGKVLKERE